MVCGKEAQLLLKKGVLYCILEQALVTIVMPMNDRLAAKWVVVIQHIHHFIGLVPLLVHKVNEEQGILMGADIRDDQAYIN